MLFQPHRQWMNPAVKQHVRALPAHLGRVARGEVLDMDGGRNHGARNAEALGDVALHLAAEHEFGRQRFNRGNFRHAVFSSPGAVRKDEQRDLECKTVETNKDTEDCMQRCQLRRIVDPGTYNVFTRQCTEFVRSCAIECGLTKKGQPPPKGPQPGPLYRYLPGN